MRARILFLGTCLGALFALSNGQSDAGMVEAAPAFSQLTESMDPDGFHYGFSECVNNERTLYYYHAHNTTCQVSPNGQPVVVGKPPVSGLRCDVPCDRGTYLDADFSSGAPVSACRKCPRGSYSLGGGELFSIMTESWKDPLPKNIFTNCVTRNLETNEWASNCEPWKASPHGDLISSGENSDIQGRFSASRLFSTLRISATFVQEGLVTFQYYVDAEEKFDGLVFQIDGEQTMKLVSSTDGWVEASFLVKEGAHTLTWVYTKDGGTDEGEDKAYLRVVEVIGTSYSDTHCHKCGGQLTTSGGDMCAFCEENEFAAPISDNSIEYGCNLCPDGMFAPRGSIGIESCIERRPCSWDDLLEIPTDCANGFLNVTFGWIDPRTCDLTHEDSIDLPDPVSISCSECNPGFFWTENGACTSCSKGQYFQEEAEECRSCPDGQVPMKELHFGNNTEHGWRKWPSIFDVASAHDSGWILTRNALAWVPQASQSVRLGGSSSFSLLFNVTFDLPGTISLTYELANLPSGDRDRLVWLELIVDDAIKENKHVDNEIAEIIADDEDEIQNEASLLENGMENGTFTEVIPIDVTRRTTKQFTLMLRTASSYVPRNIQARIIHMSFRGTTKGGSVECARCSPGSFSSLDGCKFCRAGSFAQTGPRGETQCMMCPMNTFSDAQSSVCQHCGNHTFSKAGSRNCAAPKEVSLEVNTAGIPSYNVSYNLTLLQSLVMGNMSRMNTPAPAYGNQLLSNAPVLPEKAFEMDKKLWVYFGVFRPLSQAWRFNQAGSIAEDLTDMFLDHPYVVLMTIINSQDTGGHFMDQSEQYGQVQCSVPPRFSVANGGDQFDIHPRIDGTGVLLTYSNGTSCQNGGQTSTHVDFICDTSAGNTSVPVLKSHDKQHCHYEIEWRTEYACPICTNAYFQELRTECSAGIQSVTFNNAKSCYGGVQPDGVPIATCSDIVLKGDQLYKLYGGATVVGFVVIVLFISVLVVYRKYRDAYNDNIYLRAKIPSNIILQNDGSKESTYEFSPGSTSIATSPAESTRAVHFGNEDGELHDPVSHESRGLRSV